MPGFSSEKPRTPIYRKEIHTMKKVYMLEDLDCANCALKMEDGIKKIDGVVNAEVNFMTQKMTIETEVDDQKKIMKEVVKVCRKIEPDCTILL